MQKRKTGWVHTGHSMSQCLRSCVSSALSQEHPDAVLNIESHFFDTTLVAETCQYDLDLGRDVWLHRARWSRLIREYVPQEELDRFLTQAWEILKGLARDGATANLMFRDPDRYEKKHRWGGCLMGATFRKGKNHRPTLTFFSRTTYMGYMGLLDAAIAHCIARSLEIVDECRFVWHITSMQLHHFKSLPYLYSQNELYDQLRSWDGYELDRDQLTAPWYYVLKWHHKVLDAFVEHGEDMLAHEKYGPFRRIKRRWMEHEGHLEGKPPNLPLAELTFEKSV